MESYFPDHIKVALKNNPPGEWMPVLPEDCIRLSSGYPEPRLIPANEIKAAVGRLVAEEGDLPFHYIGSPRAAGLRKMIQEQLKVRGIVVQEDELLITAGALQAIDLIARIFLDEHAVVAVESPTYMEALEIFQNYTNQIISIPVDEQGLQTDELEEILLARKRACLTLPRILYIIPTFQNPTGTTLTPDRRKRLLELSIEYDFLILEDDPYGELSFFESPLPLKAIDTTGRVLHVGSLSKVVAPGLRIGWLAGAKEFVSAAFWFKKDLDHSFVEATMAVYLENIEFENRLKTLRNAYREKSEIMIRALEQYFPDFVTWFVPKGGYFVWVKITGVDTSILLEQALSAGVSYIPGKYFFLDQKDGAEYLRLSFSYSNEKEIVQGIQKLGELVTTFSK